MALRQITPPATEPLTVAEVGRYLRLTAAVQALDADYLSLLIAAVREDCEQQSERQLITATWQLTLDSFPLNDGYLELPRPPLQSVTSIVYTDTEGGSQTLDASLYGVDIRREPGQIVPAYNEDWAETREQINAVTITYVAGYGDDGSDVPAKLRLLMQAAIAFLYDNRYGPEDVSKLEFIRRGYQSFWHGSMDPHT